MTKYMYGLKIFYIFFLKGPQQEKFLSSIDYRFIDHTFAGYIVNVVIVPLIARFGDFVLMSLLWVHKRKL